MWKKVHMHDENMVVYIVFILYSQIVFHIIEYLPVILSETVHKLIWWLSTKVCPAVR